MDISSEEALDLFNFYFDAVNSTEHPNTSLTDTTIWHLNSSNLDEVVNNTGSMNITTTIQPYQVPTMDVFRMCIYIIEGIIIVTSNGLLLTTIIRHQALRMLKEFIVLAGLATADALVGLGTMSAGIYRLQILFANQQTTRASRKWCFFRIHNLLWLYGVPVQSFMLLLVSIDRFLCVWSPRKYIQYQQRMLSTIAAVYGLLAVQFLVMGIRVWNETDLNVTVYCYENMAALELDYVIFYNISISAALASVIVYAAVIVVYKKRFVTVSAATTKDLALKDDLKRQRDFTAATSISCFCTLTLFAIPNTLVMMASIVEWMDYGNWAVSSFIISNINPMLNVLIYFKKQKEFRIGVKALFMNKTMPPNIRMWTDKFTLNMLFNPDAEMVDEPVK